MLFKIEKKKIKDFVKDTYQEVEKFLLTYTYEGENFEFWYESEKKALQHRDYLLKDNSLNAVEEEQIRLNTQIVGQTSIFDYLS